MGDRRLGAPIACSARRARAPLDLVERLRWRGRRVIDQLMRTIAGVDTSNRSPEGWVALPTLISALEEGRRVALEVSGERYIVGHTAYCDRRWWLVPDWFANASNLHLYEES